MIDVTLPRINTGLFDFSPQEAIDRQNPPLTFRQYIIKVTKNRYKFYDAFDPVIDAFQQIANGEIKRLILNMHPRSGKSLLLSELGSSYFLYCHREKWVGLASYSASLSEKFSRESRQYYNISGASLQKDAKSVKEWMTPARGGLWAAGADGAMLGRGYDLGIVDDIFKNEKEAGSTLIRMRRSDWLLSTFWNRAEPNASIVLSMHRWHKNDIIAQISKLEGSSPEKWTIIDREAIKTERVKVYPVTYNVINDTRDEGEALVPDRYNVEYLNKIKSKSSYFWDVQYQQDARAKEGLVYYNFNQNNIIDTVDKTGYYWCKFAIDFGAINETIGIFLLDRFGNYTLIDAFQLPNMTTEQRANVIRKRAPKDITTGHGGAASETQQRAEYKSQRLTMPNPKVTDIDVQINRTNEWLKSGKLRLHSGFECFNDVIGMFDDCIRDSQGDIIDASIWHYLDMIRYFVSGEFGSARNLNVANYDPYKVA